MEIVGHSMDEDLSINLIRYIVCLQIRINGCNYELRNLHLDSVNFKDELKNLSKRHKSIPNYRIIYLGDFNYNLTKTPAFPNYQAVFLPKEYTNTKGGKCYDNFLVPRDIYAKISQRKVAEIQCISPILKTNTTFFAPNNETMMHSIIMSNLTPQLVSDHYPIYIDLT